VGIERALRYLVADVLEVDIEHVVDEASLTHDLGMFCFSEAELGNVIEEEYDLRSGWWREDSDTFGDLVRDVRRALAGRNMRQVEDQGRWEKTRDDDTFSATRQISHAH